MLNNSELFPLHFSAWWSELRIVDQTIQTLFEIAIWHENLESNSKLVMSLTRNRSVCDV